jgi:uncharacterized repeat protein (TIGR03837 family)
VIDHLGDVGASLRLARELARRGYRLRLYCDRPDLAHALHGAKGEVLDRGGERSLAEPATALRNSSVGACKQPVVEICAWPSDEDLLAAFDAPAHLIISAFGCELPAHVRTTLAPPSFVRSEGEATGKASVSARGEASVNAGIESGGPSSPLWIHLDYLSAEAWVGGFHGRASIKPDGARQIFAFPGFDAQSAGLPGTAPRRGPGADHEASPALNQLSAEASKENGGRPLSIFAYAYAHANLGSWSASIARAFRKQRRSGTLVHPAATLTIPAAHEHQWPSLKAWLAAESLGLTLLAQCPQVLWDERLAASDLLLVRGEDSWVFAMRSGVPWLWQPYPQEPQTLQRKLGALLGRMEECLGELPGWSAWKITLAAWGHARMPPDDALDVLMQRWPQSPWHRLAWQWALKCNAAQSLADGLAVWIPGQRTAPANTATSHHTQPL